MFFGGLFQHAFEQLAFATMRAQVAGIKKPPAAGFDFQSVGIESGMIDEMRRDREWADLQRLFAFEIFRGFKRKSNRHKIGRRAHDAFGRFAHHDGNVVANRRNEPPVIAMSVGQDDCKQRGIMLAEAGNFRNEGRVRFVGIERQAEIDNNAASDASISTQVPPICLVPRWMQTRSYFAAWTKPVLFLLWTERVEPSGGHHGQGRGAAAGAGGAATRRGQSRRQLGRRAIEPS